MQDKPLTPYDAALLKGHTECAELLRAHGGEPIMETAEEMGEQTPVAGEKHQDKAKDHVPEEDDDKLKETSEPRPEDSTKDDKVKKTVGVSPENGEKDDDEMEKTAKVSPKNDEKEDGTEPNTAEVNTEDGQKEESKVTEGERPESEGEEKDKTPRKPDGTTEDTPAEETDKNKGDKTDTEDASDAKKSDKDQGSSDKEQVDNDNKETDNVRDNANGDDNKGVKEQAESEAEVDPVASTSHDESPDNKISASDDVKDDTCVNVKRGADEEQTDNEASKGEATKPEADQTADSGDSNPDSVQAERNEYNDLVKMAVVEKKTEAVREETEKQISPVHKELSEDSVKDEPTEKKAAASDSDSSDGASSPKPQQNGSNEDHTMLSKEDDKSREEDIDNQDKPDVSTPDSKKDKDDDETPKKPDETVPSESPEGPTSNDNDNDNNKDETSDDDFWSPVHKKSEGGTEKGKEKDGGETPQEEKPATQSTDTDSKVPEGVSEDTKKVEAEPRDSGMENSTDGEHTSEDDIQQDKAHAKENKPETWANASEKSPSKTQEPVRRNPRKPQRPKTVCVTERKHASRPQPIKHASQYPEKRRKSQQDMSNGDNNQRPLADENVNPPLQLTRPKTSTGLRRCRNEIQESVRVFEVKKLVIQMIQKTRKLRMFNTYRQMMSDRAMVRMLVRDYNQLSRHKQDEKDFSSVSDWEMFLLGELQLFLDIDQKCSVFISKSRCFFYLWRLSLDVMKNKNF